MNYFIFNNISSASLGVRIKSKNVYSAPKLDASLISVPGRNGDIISSNNKYSNVNLSYTCFLPAKSIEELAVKIRNVKKWLYHGVGEYHELLDSYDSTFFRKAAFISKLDISDEACKIGTFTISFSCMPLRFQIEGQQKKTFDDSFVLNNPYPFASKPYIKVKGNGTGKLFIQTQNSNKSWNFLDINEYVECDSELMNFYKGETSLNNKVTGDGFPELPFGNTAISFDGGITGIEIIPRWVCI